MHGEISRRRFTQAAAAGLAFSTIPGRVLGANSKVNLACIGIGNQGSNVLRSMQSAGLANFVALCDVDIESDGPAESKSSLGWNNAKTAPAKTLALLPDVPRFRDFREMFDKMGDKIDAVTIAVPDHSHFPITMAAMALGKHVYVEKPMARTFQEVELMMAAAKRHGVVTQMGNQGHSGNNFFQFKAWKEAGIIRDVTHVDAYMNSKRRWHSWGEVKNFPAGESVPEGMDWDVWQGTAQPHDYSSKFHYGNWRGWHDFGTGCFGDWGAHILDTIHQFLELGLPSEIGAKKIEGLNPFIYPLASVIKFGFPARGSMPALDIDWYDGVGNLPPIPKEFAGREANKPGKFIYSKEYIFQGNSHSDTLQIIPYEKMRSLLEAGRLPKDFGKNSNHYENFLLACRGDEQTRSPFDVAGPLSQMLVLGCLAQRLNTTLRFDRTTKQITNSKLANDLLVGPPPRKGWEQYYTL